MKFKNILLFFIITAIVNSISAVESSVDENSANEIKQSDALPDELGQNPPPENIQKSDFKEIDYVPAEMNLEGKIKQLQEEKSNLQAENKELNEKNNELIKQMDKIVLHQLWKNCMAENKGLKDELSKFESDLLISNQHIKNMCKITGWCKGNEDNPSDEFAQNSEQYKDLEWQVKNDLHENLNRKDNEIKELKQNIAQQKELNLQKENDLCENLTSKDNQIKELEKKLSDEAKQGGKLLQYLKTICEQTGDGTWDCSQIDEEFLEFHRVITKSYKNTANNLGASLEEAYKGYAKLSKDYSQLSDDYVQTLHTLGILEKDHGKLNSDFKKAVEVSNKANERIKELTTNSGAAGILYANFVDTLILHKIKVLAGTIVTIGGYLFYKKRDSLSVYAKKVSVFLENSVEKLKNGMSKFFKKPRNKK